MSAAMLSQEALDARAAFTRAFAQEADWLGQDELVQQGWDEILVEDPKLAVESLFSAQGGRVAASPALDLLIASALGDEVWKAVRDGARVTLPFSRTPLELESGDMTGYSAAAPTELVALRSRGVHLYSVTAGLRTEAVTSLDQTVTFHRVVEWGVAQHVADLDSHQAEHAAALAHLGLAYEAVACVESMLELTMATAGSRMVYGQPLTQYQVVKHQLATVYEALVAAHCALGEAWRDLSVIGALLGREAVGRAVMMATSICPQVCGGMSTTLEFAMHRYVRRTLMNITLFGTPRTRTTAIGSHITHTGEVPRFRVPHEISFEVAP